MCGIQRIERVNTLPPYILQGNRLALGIVDQPIFVMFVNPGAAAYLEWRRPQANREAVSQNMMGHKPHAIRELRRVGGDVLAARTDSLHRSGRSCNRANSNAATANRHWPAFRPR